MSKMALLLEIVVIKGKFQWEFLAQRQIGHWKFLVGYWIFKTGIHRRARFWAWPAAWSC